MGNFRRNNRSGGRRDFGRPNFRDRGGSRQMFDAVCSNCGKDCQIPFRPTGNKPVFCSECFEKMGGSSGSRGFADRTPRRSYFQNSNRPQNNAQLEAISAKLDKILKILEPTFTKPAEESKIEKEIEIQPEKSAVVVKKKTTKSKKTSPTSKK
jgi:CxxC-x17-CxxC domain-containing protein